MPQNEASTKSERGASFPREVARHVSASLKRFGTDHLLHASLHNPLTDDDALYAASLPVGALAKLVQHRAPFRVLPSRNVLLVSSAVQSQGLREERAGHLRTRIREIQLPETPLLLALDSWEAPDVHALEERLATLCDAIQGTNVQILGPSTREVRLQRLLPREEFFALLDRFEIRSLSGGGHLETFAAAVERGFEITFAHDLSLLASSTFDASQERIRRPLYLQPESGAHEPLLVERVVHELLELRARFGKRLVGWFPWIPNREVVRADTTSLVPPEELLCIIALARLIFGSSVRVTAPVNFIGEELVPLVTLFGANDFGFVAADAESARLLSIPRRNTTAHQLNFLSDAP